MSRSSRGTMVRLTFRLLFWQYELLDDLLIDGTIIDNYSNSSLNSLINTEGQKQLLQEDGEGLLYERTVDCLHCEATPTKK